MVYNPSFEGTIPFKVGNDTYQTWYQIYGDPKTSSIPPLVLLHGGPGFPSDYMLPLTELNQEYSIPVVIYDQLGCGNSTHLPDKSAEFWTPELFMDELDNLLVHLRIVGNFSLLGSSWGGSLGSEYVAKRLPSGLKRFIIGSSGARMEDWVNSNLILVQDLPQDLQDDINAYELDPRITQPEPRKAIDKFNTTKEIDDNHREIIEKFQKWQVGLIQFQAKHVCRTQPPPEAFTQSLTKASQDTTVLRSMYGYASLRCTGSLKSWSVIDVLHHIKVPTLVYHGEFDQAQDFVIAPFLEKIPNVKCVKFQESSHLVHLEKLVECKHVIANFLLSE